jgi:hypothetical protein
LEVLVGEGSGVGRTRSFSREDLKAEWTDANEAPGPEPSPAEPVSRPIAEPHAVRCYYCYAADICETASRGPSEWIAIRFAGGKPFRCKRCDGRYAVFALPYRRGRHGRRRHGLFGFRALRRLKLQTVVAVLLTVPAALYVILHLEYTFLVGRPQAPVIEVSEPTEAAAPLVKPTIASVTVAGDTVTIRGRGFSPRCIINLFNEQAGKTVNIGGFVGGEPVIRVTFIDSTEIGFMRPARAQRGKSFVEVLNPPYNALASTGNDPRGSFTFP